MSTRRKTSKAVLSRRFTKCQRIRQYSKNCCSAKLYSQMEKLHSDNERYSLLRNCEAMFNKFFVKFSQCRPRVQSLQNRLQESFKLLSEIDELLLFFSDPQSLWSYLLEEPPEEDLMTSEDTEKERTFQNSDTPANQKESRREEGKNVSSVESHCSRKPEVETIVEETEDCPPVATENQSLQNAQENPLANTEWRSSSILSRSSHLLTFRQTPEAPLFSSSQNGRTKSFFTNTWLQSSKRIKTSTPAERSPLTLLSSPRISIIPHFHLARRQRRKALMVEPPEENGAWSGTPVIRNQKTCTNLNSKSGNSSIFSPTVLNERDKTCEVLREEESKCSKVSSTKKMNPSQGNSRGGHAKSTFERTSNNTNTSNPTGAKGKVLELENMAESSGVKRLLNTEQPQAAETMKDERIISRRNLRRAATKICYTENLRKKKK